MAYEWDSFGISEESLDMPHSLRGMNFFFRGGGGGGFFEISVSNKLNKSNQVSYNNRNTPSTYQLKCRINTFNMGAAFGGEIAKIGASLDIGGVKLFQKLAPEEEFGAAEWEKMYDGSLFTGFTIFASIGPKFLEIRPYFQSSFFIDEFSGFPRDKTFNATNWGININLLFGALD